MKIKDQIPKYDGISSAENATGMNAPQSALEEENGVDDAAVAPFRDIDPHDSTYSADVGYDDFAENIPSSGLRWPGATPTQLRFMRRVYDAHVARASRRRRFTPNVPAADLGTIEGRFRARTAAADACRDLLRDARAAINAQGVNVQVGLTSAYRSASHQFQLWQNYFPDYYSRTQSTRQGLTGGEHGTQAVQYMTRFVGGRIAAPGYSLHNSGLAVDLRNVENGRVLRNRSTASATRAWRRSWLWGWLTTNANRYGFYQNTTINEPWHWRYRSGASGTTTGAGSAAAGTGSTALSSLAAPLNTAFTALKSFVKGFTDYTEGLDLPETPGAAAVSAGAAVASLGFEILRTTINTFREGDVTLIKPTSQVGVVATGAIPSWVRRNTRDARRVIFRTRESNPISGLEQVNIQLECIVQYNGPEVKASFSLTAGGARSRVGRDTRITINNPLDLRTRQMPANWRRHNINEYPEVRIPITVRVDRPWPMENWNWSFDLMLSGLYGIGVNRNGRIISRDNFRRYNN
jgi:LAS superfamily LD-carboxypeptidase LdcB